MRKNKPALPYMEWLASAQDDEDTIELILSKDGPSNPACFHAQQMAEKILKAFLVYKNLNFRKVHDLVDLAMSAKPAVPKIINELAEELTLLNRFYIHTRYPADSPEFNPKDAQRAFNAAKKIKDFIIKKIK